MTDWSDIIGDGLKVGSALLDKDKRNAFFSFMNYLTRTNKKILLFGQSGSGKSQFIESLQNSINTPLRTHSSKTYKIPIANFPLKFIDTPGHDEHNMARREQIDGIIKDGVEGIINIVSFGYHEIPKIDKSLVFDKNQNIKDDFLVKNRLYEVEQLAEWLPRISPNQNVKWIINLITKSDIWWDAQDSVLNHYKTGAYGSQFKSYDKFMKIINLPYCSVIKPYLGEISSSTFGEQEKRTIKMHFINEFIGLISK